MTSLAEPRWQRPAALVLAILGAAGGLGIVLTYLIYPGYLEYNEASMVALGLRMLAGQAVYSGADAIERISHAHGPMTFLWSAWPMALFGTALPVTRLSTALAGGLIFAVLALIGRRQGHVAVCFAVAMAAATILLHLNMSIVVRPDAPLTVVVGLAVLAVLWGEARNGEVAPSLLLGLACGIAVNFKINSALYLLPLALYWVAGGWVRRVPAVGAAAIGAVLAPFAATGIFPLGDYLMMMAPMAAKENVWNGFTTLWWKFAIYLVLPPLLWALGGQAARQRLDGRMRLYLGSYVACVVLTLFSATKIGAGSNHYMPFMPLTVDLVVRALAAGGARRQRTALVIVMALVLGACWQPGRRFAKALDWAEARGINGEIAAIMADNAGKSIQMGVGGVTVGDPLTFRYYNYRSLLFLAGNPYTLDTGTVMEQTKLGIALPAEVIRRIATCHTELWLVPKGEEPFSLFGYYFQYVYPPEFRRTFAATHAKVDSRRYFDVWACRGK
ncbi:MAG: glycosyltransferase family 39 protein [Magnetospirillum sp.]|nr:glycosyltransferase family 39 protein [Magnetospirillum sp.]